MATFATLPVDATFAFSLKSDAAIYRKTSDFAARLVEHCGEPHAYAYSGVRADRLVYARPAAPVCYVCRQPLTPVQRGYVALGSDTGRVHWTCDPEFADNRR